MKYTVTLFLIILILLTSLCAVSCSDSKETPQTEKTTKVTTPTVVPTEDATTIIIGNLTDLTGPSSSSMRFVNVALEDMVNYYNDNDLIPGVELKLISYDGQMDPSKVEHGYEWLKAKNADFIFTAVPGALEQLKSKADTDEFLVFGATGDKGVLDPPGYVFVLGTIVEHEAYTLLKWIAEEEWDYQTNGPAKIGGASWDDYYSPYFFAAMKEYAEAHPDQFEWVNGFITNLTFTWGPQVEALKDCDYVCPPTIPMSFIQQYRAVGGRAQFIGTDVLATTFEAMRNADLWDDIDGTLFITGTGWWNDENETIELAEELINTYRQDEAETIKQSGVAYFSIGLFDMLFDSIAKTVERVGQENFSSSTHYETLQSYSMSVDGIADYFTLNENKQYASNYWAICRINAADASISKAHPGILPSVTEP